jgi:hypothetical protein
MAATKTAKKSAAETPEAQKMHPCACQNYEIEIWTGDVPEGADPGDYLDLVGTDCVSETASDFAPGHDAKLKSLLIRAGAEGHAVRRNEEGMAVSGDPVGMAGDFNFEYMVKKGIERAVSRVNAQRAKKEAAAKKRADKAAKKVADKLKMDHEGTEAAREGALKQARQDLGLTDEETPAQVVEEAREQALETAREELNVQPEAVPTDGAVTIKVGRWTYEAVIDTNDNSAHYSSGNGVAKVAPAGKYQIV